MNNGVDVYIVELGDSDPSELGFEKIYKKIENTELLSLRKLMEYKLLGVWRKSKRIKYDGTIKRFTTSADVHIRNLKRHKEYREVFSRLMIIFPLQRRKIPSLYYGDIVHQNGYESAEVVEMTQTFLKPIGFITNNYDTSNHDFNLNNPNRLDFIITNCKPL